VSHAHLIVILGGLISVPIMLSRESMRSPLSLAALVPGATMESSTYLLLSVFDFFALWWVVALGVMVARAGRLNAWKPVSALLGIYFVVVGGIAGIRIALS
jgi:hypothetical protein